MEIRDLFGLYDLRIHRFGNPHHPPLMDPQSHPGFLQEEEHASGDTLDLAITFGQAEENQWI